MCTCLCVCEHVCAIARVQRSQDILVCWSSPPTLVQTGALAVHGDEIGTAMNMQVPVSILNCDIAVSFKGSVFWCFEDPLNQRF